MSVETDANGRLYLPAALREKYGEKFHVVEYEDRIELLPIADDPLAAVREEIGDTLAGQSRADLRAAGRDTAKAEAVADTTDTGDSDSPEMHATDTEEPTE